MRCELDYRHKAVWCDACFEAERQAKFLRLAELQLMESERMNDLTEDQMLGAGIPRQERRPPPPPPGPVPATEQKRGGADVRPQSMDIR